MSVCVVNLVELDPETNGGLSRVARELSQLLFDLSQEQPTFYPVFVVGDHFASRFTAWIDRKPVVVPVNRLQPGRPLVCGLNPDLIISPLFGVEPFDQIHEFDHIRHIAMMPDTLALDFPQLFNPSTRIQRRRSYKRLKSADRIITLSDYARNQLIHHLELAPESVASIYLGADSLEQNSPSELEIPRPYLFYPANTWPHKRHELALQIFGLLLQERPELHLVMTGGRVSDFGVELSRLVTSNRITADHVHDLGYVSDSQVMSLYQNAEALLFTSSYEGFGMPVLEAMRLGCPVICAPLTAIPEVAGDAAFYVDSDDPDEWARAILNDFPNQRASLIELGKRRAAQFSWQQTRARYRQFLFNTAPEVFGQGANTNAPMVSLPMVLQEVDGGSNFIEQSDLNGIEASSFAALPPADLNVHLQYMNTLLQEEKQSRLGRIPIIGLLVRAYIRLRNIGRFWRSSSVVAHELARRQTLLAARINARDSN